MNRLPLFVWLTIWRACSATTATQVEGLEHLTAEGSAHLGTTASLGLGHVMLMPALYDRLGYTRTASGTGGECIPAWYGFV